MAARAAAESLQLGSTVHAGHGPNGRTTRRLCNGREDQTLSTLQQGLRGPLIGPEDPDYDTVRALYNRMIEKRPRLIARCLDAADVMAAVNYARDEGLLVWLGATSSRTPPAGTNLGL